MTNDIVKIKSVAAQQGGETEHGLMLDSSILSYTYQGSSKTVKWILDTIFTLLGGKAASATTLAGYGITDAYTKTQVDTALAGKAASVHTHTKSQITDFAHNHSQSDITGLIAALDAKENQGNKLHDWDGLDPGQNTQYPDALLVKQSLDEKLNGEINILESTSVDLDTVNYGETYFIDNTGEQPSTSVFYSTMERQILFHQGYAGAENKFIIFRTYLVNSAYMVEIAGLYDTHQ